jgi:hypothetical protein
MPNPYIAVSTEQSPKAFATRSAIPTTGVIVVKIHTDQWLLADTAQSTLSMPCFNIPSGFDTVISALQFYQINLVSDRVVTIVLIYVLATLCQLHCIHKPMLPPRQNTVYAPKSTMPMLTKCAW